MSSAQVLGLTLMFNTLSLALSSPGEDEVAKGRTVLAEQEKRILEYLKNDASWTDRKNRSKTTEYVRMGGDLRSSTLVPILVRNITFSSTDGIGLKSISYYYPAYGALKKIGMPSVAPILQRLKDDGADEGLDAMERNYLISCLVDIYEQGGFGVEITRLRITEEMKKADAKQKANLEQVLKHPILNPAKRISK
jgi:hypothetical protein